MASSVDKHLCIWYWIVLTFRSFTAGFLHFLAKLVCRYKLFRPPTRNCQKLRWMIKPAFCLFGLLGISHLFLADKPALIWRSQDTGVRVSVVTGLVYRNHSFLLSCLTLYYSDAGVPGEIHPSEVASPLPPTSSQSYSECRYHPFTPLFSFWLVQPVTTAQKKPTLLHL